MKLIQLARKTIEFHFDDLEFIPNKKTREKFKEKRASFVTLTKEGNLRGCIGCLEARQELWKDVQENVINAAFHDTRFMPLEKSELNKIKIEVSVLSEPKRLKAKNSKFLVDKITKDIGLILRQGMHTATFLPQVWKQIPNKEEFLEQLSLKAGLDKDAWKSAEIWCYEIEKEEE